MTFALQNRRIIRVDLSCKYARCSNENGASVKLVHEWYSRIRHSSDHGKNKIKIENSI